MECTPVGLVHCSRNPQTLLFNNFFIKNGSHSTIHTFKNYFTTVFLVFSFQQNKLYPNGPLDNKFSKRRFKTMLTSSEASLIMETTNFPWLQPVWNKTENMSASSCDEVIWISQEITEKGMGKKWKFEESGKANLWMFFQIFNEAIKR